MWTLRYHLGTLIAEGASAQELPPDFVFDRRVGHHRGPAWRYAELALKLRREGRPFEDLARRWEPLPELPALARRQPRPYQQAALEAWNLAGRRGLVLLPTGAGKTLVAELAIAAARRPTLVIAPTLDLVSQWSHRLQTAFGLPVGILGGGHHEIEQLTVSTYDSAHLHLPRYGDRFGLVIFDEVHHLPAPAYLSIAECCLAPFRLGLTATLERQDGREGELTELVGPVVYEKTITELSGEFLASYDVVRLVVQLSAEEQAAYDGARKRFLDFVASRQIRLGGPQGWQGFLRASARSEEGRAAFRAYREYRNIAHGTERKLDLLVGLLAEEKGRRTIIFTHDNATAYRISRELLIPCISHQTEVRERRAFLEAFEAGRVRAIVTSRVLNEGVDLPAAEVAIVLSGTGTVREHVQRLGRILRPSEGKFAVLYEVVAAGTAELGTSDRRRRHDAYR